MCVRSAKCLTSVFCFAAGLPSGPSTTIGFATERDTYLRGSEGKTLKITHMEKMNLVAPKAETLSRKDVKMIGNAVKDDKEATSLFVIVGHGRYKEAEDVNFAALTGSKESGDLITALAWTIMTRVEVRCLIKDAMELYGQFAAYPDDEVEERCYREGNFEKWEQYCADRRKEAEDGCK